MRFVEEFEEAMAIGGLSAVIDLHQAITQDLESAFQVKTSEALQRLKSSRSIRPGASSGLSADDPEIISALTTALAKLVEIQGSETTLRQVMDDVGLVRGSNYRKPIYDRVFHKIPRGEVAQTETQDRTNSNDDSY